MKVVRAAHWLLCVTSLTYVTSSSPPTMTLPYLQALQACTYNGPLGMTTGEIRAGQISASSNYPPEWDRGCSQKFARVYQPGDQAWCAKYKSASEWLQVDLGVPAKVTGLLSQGRGEGNEWVTSFLVSYSLDAYHWLYITDQYNNQRVFEGNVDAYTVKHYYLDDAVLARYVKFHTVQWHRHPSMRVEIIGCQVCKMPIALPPYGKVQASSEKRSTGSGRGGSCAANDGYIITSTAWCAKRDNADQWLQFDIGPPTLVTGVVTKGRGDGRKKYWVTEYRLSYSNDSRLWHFYKDEPLQDIKEFTGNEDRYEERQQFLKSPFIARYVRIHPTNWHRHIGLRAGLLGCPYVGDCGPGFMRVNDYSPCVENLAFKKESFINNRRQHKRHASQHQWMHGHAARAVDGQAADHSIHSCAILDNFYVEKPIWMVDLGRVRTVNGIVILTWTGHPRDTRTALQDYMHNLDRLKVYVDSKGGREQVDQAYNVCGSLTRLNDALFKPRLHVACAKSMTGRYVYVEAWGVENRWSRLFGAVLCEVMVYE